MLKILIKKISIFSLVFALLINFVACGSKKEESSDKKTQDSKPVQELTLINADPATLDVNDVRNSNEFQVLSQIQEGLFRVLSDENGNDKITNAGAESYSVSEDGKTYTFHLRDYKWSDGVQVTAQQYVDSIKRLLNPENAFSYSFMAYDIVGAQDYYNGKVSADKIGVKAIDDKTLEIKLRAALPFFIKKLTNVCFFPVRLDVIKKAGDKYATDINLQVYNGPFVIKSRIKKNEMVLEKNKDYWDAANVKLDKVTLKEITEQSTQSLLLDSKELDVVVATTEYVNKWKKKADQGKLVRRVEAAPSCAYLVYNHHTGGTSKLMNNAKVTKALALAVDRDELNDLIYDGMMQPAYGIIPPGIQVGDKEFRSLNKEPLKVEEAKYPTPEKLKALFQEGMKEEGLTGDTSTVTITMLGMATSNQDKASQEFYKQQWESKLGIKVKLNAPSDTSLFVAERDANHYDVVVMGWGGDYNDPMTFMELFKTGSGYAKYMGGYSNPEYDKLFKSLATEGNIDKRAKTYVALENNLVGEEVGIAPLYYTINQIFIQNYVKNLSSPTFGSQFDFSRAYIEGK